MKPDFLKYPRLPYLQRPLLLTCFFLIFVFVFTFAIGDSTADGLHKILPVDSILGDVKSVGGAQEIEGNQLFELINGGAVIFFQHNFKRALFQEYTVRGSKSINLEIYQMGSPQDARDIYTIKKEKGGTKLRFGQEGFLFDYYCMLYQGPYFISITGADSTDAIRKVLTSIAQQVVDNIKVMPLKD